MLRRLGRLRAALLLLPLALGACASTSGVRSGGSSEEVGGAEFIARCEADVLTPQTPQTPEEAEAAKASGASWTDDEAREVYLCTIATIDGDDASLAAEGASLEARARAAYATRHRARITARAMMSDPLEVKALEARDLSKYGHKDGPTFEYLLAKGRAEGKSDDEIYEGIISSSKKTDKATNSKHRR